MGLRPVRPNNQWVWSLRQEGIKGLGLCLLDLSHPFERTEPLSLPLPLPKRIQRKRWCPPLLLEDPYRLHQTHKWNQVGTIWHRDLWYNIHVIQHAILYDHCSEYGILQIGIRALMLNHLEMAY